MSKRFFDSAAASFDQSRAPPSPYNPAPAMSLPGGTKLGTFEIVRLLGAGGMGEVYLARDRAARIATSP